MSNRKLLIMLATMNEAKGFTSSIVKDCISQQSEEWAKGYVAGFNLSYTRNKEDLFSPENYHSDDPEQYEAGHIQGQKRGHQYQGMFLDGLVQAGIYKPAANNNRKEKE